MRAFLTLWAVGAAYAASECTVEEAKCYKDFVNGKRMMVAAGGKKMDRTGCIEECHSKGFPLAGLEYGGECYCANIQVLLGDLERVKDAECGMPCPGKSGLMCGGVNRLTVIAFKCSSAAKPTPAPTAVPRRAASAPARPSAGEHCTRGVRCAREEASVVPGRHGRRRNFKQELLWFPLHN